MFWISAYPLPGQVGGGWVLEIESFLGPLKWHRADWALEIESFLGPLKWHRADRRVPFRLMPFHRVQKNFNFQGPTLSHLPSSWICTHPKYYAQGCINHRCIGGFMHKTPTRKVSGPILGGGGAGE